MVQNIRFLFFQPEKIDFFALVSSHVVCVVFFFGWLVVSFCVEDPSCCEVLTNEKLRFWIKKLNKILLRADEKRNFVLKTLIL
jgi:hypothetical protein